MEKDWQNYISSVKKLKTKEYNLKQKNLNDYEVDFDKNEKEDTKKQNILNQVINSEINNLNNFNLKDYNSVNKILVIKRNKISNNTHLPLIKEDNYSKINHLNDSNSHIIISEEESIRNENIESYIKKYTLTIKEINDLNKKNNEKPKFIPKIESIKKICTLKIIYDEKIDLHGFDQKTAKKMFIEKIINSYQKRISNLLVITGKGYNFSSILREKIHFWVQDETISNLIIFYTHAQQKDGGEGAFYIFLK